MSSWTGEPGDGWFRLGRLEVTTVTMVTLAVIASWVAWVIVPFLPNALYYTPGDLLAGEIWRPVTWPLANSLSIWDALNLFFFWYFGTELERQIGRKKMAWLLGYIWLGLTLAATVVGFLLPGQGLAGIGMIQFTVLLLWVAEYPNRPFFFGIPAWVIGLVLVVIRLMGMLAARDGGSLLALLLSLVLVAIAGRRVGLLSDYPWIPGRRNPRPAKVAAARPSTREETRRASDRDRLDALLDQINEHGMHSLSDAQRKELKRLSERLRRS